MGPDAVCHGGWGLASVRGAALGPGAHLAQWTFVVAPLLPCARDVFHTGRGLVTRLQTFRSQVASITQFMLQLATLSRDHARTFHEPLSRSETPSSGGMDAACAASHVDARRLLSTLCAYCALIGRTGGLPTNLVLFPGAAISSVTHDISWKKSCRHANSRLLSVAPCRR